MATETGGKTLITSKTFWVNLVGVVGMVLSAFDIVVPADWVQYEAALLAVVNIYLRSISGQPIEGVVTSSKQQTPETVGTKT